MRNWNPFFYGVVGGIIYIINSALLPDWSHSLVGVFTGLVFISIIWLLHTNQKIWSRVLISAGITIIAAAIVRLFIL